MELHTDGYEFDALRTAIAEFHPATVILIWIKARPRVTTMRPIANALHEHGYNVVVAYNTNLSATSETMGFSDHIPCFQVRAEDVRALRGVTICISSEQDSHDAPRDAKRFGIHHSLPDHALENDYAATFMIKPVAALGLDYYAIPIVQRDESWDIEQFTPYIDKQFTAALLRKRKKTMSIVPFGYPKIDKLMHLDTSGDTLDTITYAPTQSILEYSTVLQKGGEILEMLLASFPEHRIAFRPYPGPDVEIVRDVYEPLLNNPRFVMDDSPTGESLMRRTAVLVTDRSSVAVSFGFGYARPVIFYDMEGYGKPGREESAYFHPIGRKVTSISALKESILRVLLYSDGIKTRIERERGKFIFNPGRSLDYIVEIMPAIISGSSQPDWLEVPRRPFHSLWPASYRAQKNRILERVRLTHERGLPLAQRTLEPGFRYPPIRIVRSTVTRILQRMPGLRRYLSRPKDQM